MFYSSTFAPAIERDAVVTWWKRGWGTRKDRNRGMRLEDPSECPEVVPEETFKKNKSKKTFEKIWKIKIKILTFAPRFERNDWEEFFEKFTYTTVVQVFRMNTVSKILEPGNNGILSKDIKQFEQRRVWSWLRMNASDRLNTCKSRGSMNLAC